MTLRKQGTCKDCDKPLYGDEYGAAGHKCEDEYGSDGWIAVIDGNPLVYTFCKTKNGARHEYFEKGGEWDLGVVFKPVKLVYLDEDPSSNP